MSYDNRLYPEDHEPFAVKIRKKKHTTRNIIICSVFAIVFISAGVVSYIHFYPAVSDYFNRSKQITSQKTESPTDAYDTEIYDNEEKDNSEDETDELKQTETDIDRNTETDVDTDTDIASETDLETATDTSPVKPQTIPKDEWYMVLANKSNVLPETFTVKTSVMDSSGHEVDSRIVNDLNEMLSAAKSKGHNLIIATGYRTYKKQKELYDGVVNNLISAGLSEESARNAACETAAAPGTSDHNTGLGVDIVNKNGELDENSAAYKWLVGHSWEYGFILRYPKGKEDVTGQKFESWHYRYVGKEQAKLIYESEMCLEEYLSQ